MCLRSAAVGEIIVASVARVFVHYLQPPRFPVPKLMTISQFMDRYGVSRSTAYRLRDRNQIPFVHIGRTVRIPVDAADNWYQSLFSVSGNS